MAFLSTFVESCIEREWIDGLNIVEKYSNDGELLNIIKDIGFLGLNDENFEMVMTCLKTAYDEKMRRVIELKEDTANIWELMALKLMTGIMGTAVHRTYVEEQIRESGSNLDGYFLYLMKIWNVYVYRYAEKYSKWKKRNVMDRE